jgi:hypothetical protein
LGEGKGLRGHQRNGRIEGKKAAKGKVGKH